MSDSEVCECKHTKLYHMFTTIKSLKNWEITPIVFCRVRLLYIQESGTALNKCCYCDNCNGIADWCFETTEYIKMYACDEHVMILRKLLKEEKFVILTISATPHLLNPDPSLYRDCQMSTCLNAAMWMEKANVKLVLILLNFITNTSID